MAPAQIVIVGSQAALKGTRNPDYSFRLVDVDEREIGHGISHQPFLDGCRMLVELGVDPEREAVLVWRDRGLESLRGKIREGARLTVKDAQDGRRGTQFVPWQPHPETE